jgi:hypothetical protein
VARTERKVSMTEKTPDERSIRPDEDELEGKTRLSEDGPDVEGHRFSMGPDKAALSEDDDEGTDVEGKTR